MHLCSEVKGRVTLEGKPFANQSIIRSLTYEEEEVDSVYTDEDGNFSFKAKSLKSKLPGGIFHEPVVKITIGIKYYNEVYILWNGFQHATKTPTEFKKHLLKLNAELTSEKIKHHLVNPKKTSEEHFISSICRWN